MGILDRLFGGGAKWDDEPLQAQIDSAKAIRLVADGTIQLEPECDELPHALGPFGVCQTNPIPVNGPRGEVIYINRLRAPSGRGFFFHRLGSITNSVSTHPIDQYELLAIDGSLNLHLFFAMYHPRRSQRVPADLLKTPWDRMSQEERLYCKTPAFGVTSRVPDFPWGLPAVARKNPALEAISPGVGDLIARRIEKILSELRVGMKA